MTVGNVSRSENPRMLQEQLGDGPFDFETLRTRKALWEQLHDERTRQKGRKRSPGADAERVRRQTVLAQGIVHVWLPELDVAECRRVLRDAGEGQIRWRRALHASREPH